MDQRHVDVLKRFLTSTPSRRHLLAGLASLGLGLRAARLPGSADAKKNRHPKAKTPKPVFNEFGCLDVGQPCRGNHALCCSGVCQGKKPKHGNPDKRICAAHHARSCSPRRDYCDLAQAPVNNLCNLPADTAFCVVTTGKAAFCASLLGFDAEIHCQDCAKDADCEALGFPPGSACVALSGRCTACETVNRACLPPAIAG
jgi:hypothetical protein